MKDTEQKLFFHASSKLDRRTTRLLVLFLQGQVDRALVGILRYGKPERRKRYMSRLQAEVKAYVKKGNKEQLYNIALYAFLESLMPEHKNFHVDLFADSVTRKKFGGARE